MNILLIDNGTIRIKELKKLLNKHKLNIIQFNEIEPSTSVHYDLIILTGSSKYAILGNEELYQQEIELIKNTTVPVIGICLGFQLIAYSYGAKLHELDEKIEGSTEIEVIHPVEIFQRLPNFEVHSAHRWVIRDLPQELIGLAKSKDGIEVIKHKERNVYGLQFHPEMFLDRTCGDEIFNNILKTLG